MFHKVYRLLNKKDLNYRNPELPKSSVTLDNYRLAWRLLAKNRVPLYLPILFLLPFIFLVQFIVNWYSSIIISSRNISEILAFSGVVIIAMWSYFSLFRAAIPNWPRGFISQTFSYKTRLITNILGFTGLTFFGVSAFAGLVDEYIISGNIDFVELTFHPFKLLGFTVLLIIYLLVLYVVIGSIFAFLFYLWTESWQVIKRVSKWSHLRGNVLATFNKDVYEPGEEFIFQVRDNISENSDRNYRIHLSYIVEYTTVKKEISFMWDTNIKHSDWISSRRYVAYSKFIDVTAGDIHKGINWTLPKLEKSDYLNNRYPLTKFVMGKECKYWELLIEEHNSYFYARFFINVDSLKKH